MRIPLKKINRALKKRFGGRVQAVVERGVLVLRGSAEDWDGVVAAGRLAASPKSRWYTVNEVTWPGAAQRQPKPVPQTDESLAGRAPDVLLIGAALQVPPSRGADAVECRPALGGKRARCGAACIKPQDGMDHPV